MIHNIRICFRHLGTSARRWVLGLLCLTLISSMFEVVGVGLVLPFVQIVTDPDIITSPGWLSTIYEGLGFQSERRFLLFLGFCLIAVFIVKNLFMGVFYYLQYTFALTNAAHLSRRFLKMYLDAPYIMHLRRNSAELIRNTREPTQNIFTGFIISIINLIAEFFIISAIAIVLIIVQPLATLIAGTLFAGLILAYYKFLGPLFEFWGSRQLELNQIGLQSLQQSLAGIKETRVLGHEAYFVDHYFAVRQKEIVNQRNYSLTSQVPRLLNEVIMMSGMLVVVIMVVWQSEQGSDVITALALFAAAAFRLMPSINRISIALHNMRSSVPAVQIIDQEIREFGGFENQPENINRTGKVKFTRDIQFENVSFEYSENAGHAISSVSMHIKRGESIGLVGASGAGKTTFADVLLGLLTPTDGSIRVDGQDINDDIRSWQDNIGYVPQFIYISDDTLRRNVAYGVADEEIDEQRVLKALQLAHLDAVASSLPKGIDTVLDEHGTRLSGGQRQRVGIARALYHDPAVIIFDEATSALDAETEHEITLAIEALKGEKTIVVIAHRLSTVKNCDRLLFMKDGSLVDSGTLPELQKRNPDFRRMVELADLDISGVGARASEAV